jgi:hypothetical protein
MKLTLDPIGAPVPQSQDADDNRAHISALETDLEEKRATPTARAR